MFSFLVACLAAARLIMRHEDWLRRGALVAFVFLLCWGTPGRRLGLNLELGFGMHVVIVYGTCFCICVCVSACVLNLCVVRVRGREGHLRSSRISWGEG